jgi:peptidoglycan/LPS O-acetylase OafA/YrhL
MAYEGKYQGRLGDFYFNRFLRIWPAYFCCLLLSAAALFWLAASRQGLIGPSAALLHDGLRPKAPGLLLSLLSQLSLIGQDWTHFISVAGDGSLRFDSGSLRQISGLWRLNLLPQAWTLSIELCFYFLAPWILRAGNKALLAFFLLGMLLRAAIDFSPIAELQPWTLRFLPLELSVFCGGILAWRAGKTEEARALALRYGTLCFRLLLPILISLPYLLPGTSRQRVLLPFLLCALLPLLQFRPAPASWVARLGELSYPLYVVHMLVIWCLVPWIVPRWPAQMANLALPLSLAAAALLHALLERPLQRWKR